MEVNINKYKSADEEAHELYMQTLFMEKEKEVEEVRRRQQVIKAKWQNILEMEDNNNRKMAGRKRDRYSY